MNAGPVSVALGDALDAVAVAVHAVRCRLARPAVPSWPVIGVLTGGRLVTLPRGSRSTVPDQDRSLPADQRHHEQHSDNPSATRTP
jgi:hypothetical protein